MKNIDPTHPGTSVNLQTKEWIPNSFNGFLHELNHIATSCKRAHSLALFRGHRKREWLLDSTFVRSFKRTLFGVQLEDKQLSKHIVESSDLHRTLLSLFFLKFGVLMHPSDELQAAVVPHNVDEWFELMKRIQQYPEENVDGDFLIKGTNILDWTRSQDVALYFANEIRNGEGAIYICNATATGKTLQIIPVGEILEKMKASENTHNCLSMPLIFCPPHQISDVRTKNQQAVYFAQMDLRYDLESAWRLYKEKFGGECVIAKLVLPHGTESEASEYLFEKGITKEFIYPDR